MRAIKLSIHIDKTYHVIFQTKQKKTSYDIPILIDGTLLARKKQVNFLGALLDENLSWKPHIGHVCKKISKAIGIIYRARFNLSASTKLSLYSTLIYPCLTYCNIIWSSTHPSNIRRVLVLQKQIVRLMTNSDFYEHIAPLFIELNVLDIHKVNSLYVGKFMYSYHNRLLPSSFHNLLITSDQIINTTQQTLVGLLWGGKSP